MGSDGRHELHEGDGAVAALVARKDVPNLILAGEVSRDPPPDTCPHLGKLGVVDELALDLSKPPALIDTLGAHSP